MRQARLHVPGVVHHLIWRFVDHRWFIPSGDERACYLRWLGRALTESDWRCLAFAIMSNHIHIAAVAGREPLAAWSRRTNLPFARYINDRLDRIGPVFADRANDYAVAPSGVANLIGYIHNNPVRAGVVPYARDSDWTSHGAYINPVTPVAWLHVDEGLDLVQHDRDSFDAFVEGQPPDPVRPKRRTLAAAVQRYAQLNIATPFDRQFPLVMRPFGPVRPDPRRVLALVCAELGLSPAEVASRRQLPAFRLARAATVQCGLASGLSGADIASVLGLTQQAVSWTARNVKRPPNICERVLEQLRSEVRAHLDL
jgi:REP element-mobilizing transposase RayT